MPRILGLAEPKKLGGQQRVNQKRWPLCWFFLHQGLPGFPVLEASAQAYGAQALVSLTCR